MLVRYVAVFYVVIFWSCALVCILMFWSLWSIHIIMCVCAMYRLLYADFEKISANNTVLNCTVTKILDMHTLAVSAVLQFLPFHT
jgi:hypothetical protein